MHLFHLAATGRAILALLALAGFAPVAQAEPGSGAIIVFDGSGSMWGEMGPRQPPKFAAARDGLKQALGRVRPSARLGLVVFGHRRKADCQDIELVVPLEQGSAAEIGAETEKLSPKGKGPLAVTLREAAKVAADQSAAAIILLYDGLDNCQQDVCAAAAGVAKAHPGFPIHTIGLALDPQSARATACIAAATGGKSFDARDPAALGQAIESAFKLARLLPGGPGQPEAGSPRPALATPEVAAAAGPPRVRLTAHLGAVDTPIATPVKWILREPGTAKTVAEAVAAEFSQAVVPGQYEVVARLGLATARRLITVASKGVTAAEVAFDAGVVRIDATAGEGGTAAADVLLSLTPRDTGDAKAAPAHERQWIGRQSKAEIVVPSGRYVVRAAQGLARQEQEVTIENGGVSAVNITMHSGRVSLRTVEREGAEDLDGVSYSIAADDPSTPEGRREVTRSLARQPSFALPAGTYYVTARVGTAEVREQIAIGSGANVARTLVMPLARLRLSASLAVLPQDSKVAMSYRVFRAEDGAGKDVARATSERPEFMLAPGRYRIEVGVGGQNASASQTIDLPAGSRKDIALAVEAGQLALTLGGQAFPLDSFWEVRDASQRPVWRTTQAEPEGILAPGRYTVRFESRERRLDAIVDLAAGERKAVELGAE